MALKKIVTWKCQWRDNKVHLQFEANKPVSKPRKAMKRLIAKKPMADTQKFQAYLHQVCPKKGSMQDF